MRRGVVGFRNLYAFNLALLGMWQWRLRVEKNSLWCRVVEARYGVLDWVRARRGV